MIDNNCAVALATDLNPGSCFSESIPLIFALAVLYMNITTEEAITALTINGAAALNRADTIGSIDVGKKGDVIILEFPSYEYIPYHIGVSTVEKVVKNGNLVFEKEKMDNMKLADLTLKDFLSKTASKSPVPGGGSVAALSASLAASLSEMVAHLTIGKKGYEALEEEMQEIAKKAFQYRERLIRDIDRDSDAYNDVMAAFKLPKGTEQEQNNRKQAIQEALKNASLVPLGVAKNAFKIIELAGKVVKQGNKNAVTDGVVGVMMARTAVLSALYNVKINLASIKDMDFVERLEKR